MKSESHPVKVRKLNPETNKKESVQVGTATYQVYDTLAEAVDDMGEAKALERLNAQVRTDELNRVRGLSRPGGISKTMLRSKAIAAITQDEWLEVAGDEKQISSLIEKKMEQIQKQIEEDNGIDTDDGESGDE